VNKAERENLARLARKRAKLAKDMVAEREKTLAADVEDQLAAVHRFDDDAWAEITRAAEKMAAEADAKIAEITRQLGMPPHLRPELRLSWYQRGESGSAGRRAELRKLAQARIAAAGQAARTAIEAKVLEVETELVRDGLDSAEAVAYLNAMPTAEDLMPPVRIAELEGGQRPEPGWSPPVGLTAALLTPSTATDRKRQAIQQAIAAHPDESNRGIARLVGVDHKTVAKARLGDGGEIPSDAGRIPGPAGAESTGGGT
jgi:hypothetical protein